MQDRPEHPGKSRTWRSVALRAARWAVSVTAIVLLLRRVTLAEIRTAMESSRLWLFGLSTGVICLRQFLFGWRWRVVLSISGVHVSTARLTSWVMIGQFFGIFLPTTVGGDVVRMYELSRHIGQSAVAVASVLLERVAGVWAMAALAVLGLAVSPEARREPAVCLAVAGICAGCAGLSVVLFGRTLSRSVVGLLRRLRLVGLAERIERGYAVVHEYLRPEHRAKAAGALALSLGTHFVSAFVVYLIGQSLGAHVPFTYYCTSLPVLWAVLMLPISVSGIGVREGGFVFFFTAVGVAQPTALLMSFFSFLQLVVLGVVGGVCYVAHPHLFRTNETSGR